MMKSLISLLLLLVVNAVIAIAGPPLSSDCQYVDEEWNLTAWFKVEACFEDYQIDQEIVDAIIRNLRIIGGFYPYVDISMKPPSEPAGYFNKVNYTAGLEEVEKALASADRKVSVVFRAVESFINSFHDGHFTLLPIPQLGQFYNIFSPVYAFLPFQWEVLVNGNERKVLIHSPNPYFLSYDVCVTINQKFYKGVYLKAVDGKDPFLYFSTMFGKYRSMKSPQGSLVFNKMMTRGGVMDGKFSILQFPLDDLFDSHTIIFDDESQTSIPFRFGLENLKNMNPETRDSAFSLPKGPVNYPTLEEEESVLEALKNFKKRPFREEHTLVVCAATEEMNVVEISSFDYASQLDLYFQELSECVELFDTNTLPIAILLPENGGGLVSLSYATQFVLMPNRDFRSLHAMRKTDTCKYLAGEKRYFVDYVPVSKDQECLRLESEDDFNSLWEKTETDTFGTTIKHIRTQKSLYAMKATIEGLSALALKNVRKPTDMLVLTDGYCFSACSLFVNNIIRSGGAIAVGYGATTPGDDLFAASQCPSSVIDPATFFEDVKNNTMLGLMVRGTLTETFDHTNLKDSTPGDFSIIPVDRHSEYYGEYTSGNMEQAMALLTKAVAVHEEFKTKCNPKNKRLLMVSSECSSNKPHAETYGYACGSNGEWDKESCKIASCKAGYIPDFEKDECVINDCDSRYTPDPSSSSATKPSSPSKMHSSSSEIDSSSMVFPMMTLIAAAFVALFQVIMGDDVTF